MNPNYEVHLDFYFLLLYFLLYVDYTLLLKLINKKKHCFMINNQVTVHKNAYLFEVNHLKDGYKR